jgi:hypothetical protein
VVVIESAIKAYNMLSVTRLTDAGPGSVLKSAEADCCSSSSVLCCVALSEPGAAVAVNTAVATIECVAVMLLLLFQLLAEAELAL